MASLALAGLLALTAPAPALADGRASTRNIILGGAAATMLIIEHNKQVHQRYADYERRQAQTAYERDQNAAAYRSERAAYEHEAALVAALEREVAMQHHEIVSLRGQLAQRRHGNAHGAVAHREPAPRHDHRVANRPRPHAVIAQHHAGPPQSHHPAAHQHHAAQQQHHAAQQHPRQIAQHHHATRTPARRTDGNHRAPSPPAASTPSYGWGRL